MPDRGFVRRLILCGSLCLAAGLAPLLAASLQQQPVDRATVQLANMPKGTGLVMGQVVDALTNQPIAEAIVTMNGRAAQPPATAGAAPGAPGATRAPAAAGAAADAQGRRGGAPDAAAAQAAAAAAMMAARGNGIPRVMTGSDGRFVFHDLPKGTFQFTASAAGYIGGTAGQTRINGPTQMVSLEDAQHLTDVKIRLWKYASLTGVVVDDAGEPAVSVNVQVMRRQIVSGVSRLMQMNSDSTDDRGVFRITQLEPGDYFVVVPQTVMTMPAATADSIIGGLASGSAGSGGLLLDLMSSDGAMGNPLGQRVDDLIVSSRAGDDNSFVLTTGADGRFSTFQTMYYPSATSPAQATALTLKSGEERAGINIRLQLVPTSRVTGTLMSPAGPAANTALRLSPAGDDAAGASIDVATATTKADGTFTFLGVPPGQYVVRSQKSPRPPIPAEFLGANPMMQMIFGDVSAGRGGTDVTLYAQTYVAVGATDVNGLSLTLAEGAKVSGRLEFDGNSTPMPAQQLQTMTVTLLSTDGRNTDGGLGAALAGRGTGAAPPGRLGGDGQFKTTGYPPGKYVVTISGSRGGGAPGAAWILKAITVGGRDVSREALELADRDVDGAVITYTDKIAQLSGVVHDQNGATATTGTVYLVPTDYRTTAGIGSNPKRPRTASIGKTGAFAFQGLLAGEYFIAAVADSDTSLTEDPSYYEALARLATRVTVNEAEQKTFDPKIVKVDR